MVLGMVWKQADLLKVFELSIYPINQPCFPLLMQLRKVLILAY